MSSSVFHRETAATGTHVQTDTSGQQESSYVFPLRALRRWWWRSRLRILLPEFHNLACRIRWVLEIREWEHRGYREPLPRGYRWKEDSRTRLLQSAYIRYMRQKLIPQYPFLTLVDWVLLEHIWFAGLEEGVRTCNVRGRREKQAHSSAYPDSTDSSAPPSVQQSTKHDPLNQLPSRE
jgi:hypothetical protein